jgi:hypothetical protein
MFSRTEMFLFWACRVIAAVILVQTLYFKFSAAPESVYIFTKVGIEPWGRIGTGVAELLAVILIFIPGLAWMGGGLALGIMLGAIASHLTLLGIQVEGDGGLLFALAVITALCAAAVVFLDRHHIPIVGKLLP